MFKFLSGFGGRAEVGDTSSLIDLRNVRKAYKTDAGEFLALKGVNLKIDRGEFVAIIGKSGSGKSTLVNMITGIDRPTSGEIYVNGTGIHRFNEGQMARWRGLNMGVVFQFFQLLPTLTVLENVMLPMDFCGLYTPRERRERAMHLLTLVDVEGQARKLPSTLSGGQQQRVAIARALANDPPVILADEPTGSLDSKTANQVFHLFETLVAEGKTFLMVTHDDSLKERVGRRVTIADGEIIDEALLDLLPGLNPEQQVRVNRASYRQVFQPGEPIFGVEHNPSSLFLVTRGKVALERGGVREMVEPGEFFGASAVLGLYEDGMLAFGARHDGAEVLVIDPHTLADLLDENEATAHALRTALAERGDLAAAS